MKLFPHSLLRITGSSYDQLEKLEIDDAFLNDFISRKENLESFKKNIDCDLYKLIGSLHDQDKQNLLLNLKRDIYNDRNISNKNLKQVYKITKNGLKESIQTFFSLSKEVKEIKQDYEENFYYEVEKSRDIFRKLIQEKNFNKGLQLSSESLLKSLKNYSSKETKNFSRDDRKAEQGALKYITRLRTKTSPFSTFTNLSILEHDNNSDFIVFESRERSITSHVRLNNYLFNYLRDIILSNSKIYTHFLLRPNPTMRKEDGFYTYLTNKNNIESFQRIEINLALNLLLKKLSKEKEGIRFDRLIDILREYIDAEKEDLQNFINELVKYGFLEFNLGVSGIDTEWDVKLRNKLKNLEDSRAPSIAELRKMLKELRGFAQKYEKANVSGRGEILSKAFKSFKSIALKLHEEAGLPKEERMSLINRKELRKKQRKKSVNNDSNNTAEQTDNGETNPFKHKSNTYFNFKPKNIFYEDTTLDIRGKINKKDINNFTKHLNKLLSSFSFSKGYQAEKDKMVHFFKQNYKYSSAVDLFLFYEDYYRQVKKPEAQQGKNLSKERKGKENSEKNSTQDQQQTIKKIKAHKDLLEGWVSSFVKKLEAGPEEKNVQQISISQTQIEEVNKELNISSVVSVQNSLGAFIQFFNDNESGKLKGVINSSTVGFGKMLSRFLHLFDDVVKEDLREWNNSLVDEDLLLENTDASYFNANLHPPLMPNEIWIPGGHNSLKEQQQIPVTDLAVKLNGQKDELELFYKPDGKRVYLFDLGFQGIKGRSHLYQMLSKFTLMDYLFYRPLLSAVEKWMSQDKESKRARNKIPEISEYPRIEYENTIILQRKRWDVPNSLLPQKIGEESEWGYFVKVNEWRKKYKIPKEVFVYVTTWDQSAKISKKKKVSSDDYKPQYINFHNPLLVNLFKTLVRKVPLSMKIEEMLPASSQLFKVNGERFVTEFVLQWYNFNKN